LKLILLGNSPDLNAIEPTWFWMKCETTKKSSIHSNKALKEAWIECWEEMDMKLVRNWIERIPVHIQEIIQLEGGNQYKEGRKVNQDKVRIH